ncbi:MAG: tetratricopeptide repeat protein [Gammaproteobacteria bacterium]|nr:tetratricopeptide repeat protein [Gammaproteobacteria bacterium]
MTKMTLAALGLVTALAASVPAFAANDPTVQQIYRAAESGQLTQAQSMIEQVLRDHPNSAKAHYVAAELAAREGRRASARAEFDRAQALAPGLPFASARSVLELKGALGLAPGIARPAHRFPWGGVLLFGGIIALVAMLLRRRSAATVYPAGANGAYPGSPYAGPYGGGYGPGGFGGGPVVGGGSMSGGGIGGGMMGGLASGLALGAGVVAGEELAHRFLDHGQAGVSSPFAGDGWSDPSSLNADLGGDDFGISGDPGSWDDAGGDLGGGDWN